MGALGAAIVAADPQAAKYAGEGKRMRPLGIKAFKTDSRTLKLARYMTPSLPAPPDSVKWSPAVSQWGMMLNGPSPDNPSFARDGLGCCTISSLGHAIQVWSANAYHQITLPDSNILVAYEQWCGYDPNDPATDRGGIELDVLNDWRQQGLAGHMLLGYADPNVANISEVRQAINLFGGVYIGMNLPITAESQIENGQPWDVTDSSLSGDAAPGSWGGHCLSPGTRVLTADLRYVPIESLEVGDVLVGFEEFIEPGQKSRRFRSSVVEAIREIELPCYDLEFEDGTKVRCSFDHLWLVKPDGGKQKWVSTEELRAGKDRKSSIYKPFPVWGQENSGDAGYLAGVFDGEGWVDGEQKRSIHKAGFSQSYNELLDHAKKALTDRGFKYTERKRSKSGFSKKEICEVVLNTSKGDLLRFLGSIRPYRLLAKVDPSRLGKLECYGKVALISKRSCGNQTVIAVRTSTRTFIAEGLASHNCVFVMDYDQDGFTCVTWGALQRMTLAFWNAYVVEAHALLGQDWLRAQGPKVSAPNGFDIDQLAADLAAIDCTQGGTRPLRL